MLFDIKIFRRKHIRSMFMPTKHSFSSLFGSCNVHLKLGTNSVEIILVHFTIFSTVRVFLAFKNFYSILKFRFTPRFVVKKYTIPDHGQIS